MTDFESNVRKAYTQSIVKYIRLLVTLVVAMGLGYWLGGQETALRFLELFIGFQLVSAMQEIHYLTVRIDQLETKLDETAKQIESSSKQPY